MTDLLFGLDDHEQQVTVPDSTGLQGILDTSAHSPLWWTEYGLTDHYLPMPINPLLITRLARAAPVHESALACKRAAVSSGYQPPKNNALPSKDLRAAVNDFFTLETPISNASPTPKGRCSGCGTCQHAECACMKTSAAMCCWLKIQNISPTNQARSFT